MTDWMRRQKAHYDAMVARYGHRIEFPWLDRAATVRLGVPVGQPKPHVDYFNNSVRGAWDAGGD